MKHSPEINELATALAKAQGAMKGAEKDSKNPHLSNKYASLSSIIEAARKPLSDNGLAFSQLIGEGEGGVVLETILLHSSGQWLMGDPVTITTLGNKGINEAQALGSGLTYFKRYALAAMLGISVADEDDDGNSAQVQVGRQVRKQEQANGGPPKHWSEVEANRGQIASILAKEGVPIEVLFKANGVKDWEGLKAIPTGKEAKENALTWWINNKPDDPVELSPETQKALEGASEF